MESGAGNVKMKSKRTISPKTKAMLDKAAANFKRGMVSPPVSFKEYLPPVPDVGPDGPFGRHAVKRKKRKR